MLKKLFAAFAAILVLICYMPASAADCSAASFAVVDVQTGDVLMAENESQSEKIRMKLAMRAVNGTPGRYKRKVTATQRIRRKSL